MASRKAYLCLFLLVLIACTVRVYRTRTSVITNDEIISLTCAHGVQVHYDTIPVPGYKSKTFTHSYFSVSDNFRGTVNATIADNGNSVLYYLVLHSYTRILGNSIFTARLMSVAFQLAIIILVFFMMMSITGFAGAFIIGLILALQPYLVSLSIDARASSMGILLVVVSTWLFLRIVRGKGGVLLALMFGLFTGLALLTHYMTFFIPAGQFFYMLFRNRERRAWSLFITGGAVASVILGLWMYSGGIEGMKGASRINSSLVQRSEVAAGKEMVTWPVKTYSKQAVIPVYWFFANLYGNNLEHAGLKIRYVILILILALAITIYSLKRIRERFPDIVVLSMITIFVALTIATLMALTSGHMTSFEYTDFLLPFSSVVIAYILTRMIRNRSWFPSWSRICFIVIVAIIPVSLPGDIRSRIPPEGKFPNPFETTAERINASFTPGDELVFSTWYDAVVTNLYLENPDIHQVVDAQAAQKVLLRKPNGETRELINLTGQYK